MRKHCLLPWALISCACFAAPLPSWAFRVSPMIVDFSPSGQGSIREFVLDNNSKDRISVRVETLHRYLDVDGRETRTPTDELAVDPKQVTLQPYERRSVRVSWMGSHELDRELAYRLVVTELPISAQKSPSAQRSREKNVTFLMQYVASLYITPADAVPSVEVKSFRLLAASKGEIVLRNAGTAHQVIKSLRVRFSLPGGKHAQVAPEDLSALQGENILAGGERRFDVSLPAPVLRAEKAKPGSVGVSIDLQ